MKGITKILTGAAAAGALSATMAAPAQAQSWDRRDRDGIDVGDIVTGGAVIGGIAALIAALDGDHGRRYDRRYDRGYGYGYDRYGYDNPQAAVNACGREAQRYGRNIEITDLDRTNRGYRVRGRVEQVEYDYGRRGRGYDIDRERFTCYVQGGRVYDFRV